MDVFLVKRKLIFTTLPGEINLLLFKGDDKKVTDGRKSVTEQKQARGRSESGTLKNCKKKVFRWKLLKRSLTFSFLYWGAANALWKSIILLLFRCVLHFLPRRVPFSDDEKFCFFPDLQWYEETKLELLALASGFICWVYISSMEICQVTQKGKVKNTFARLSTLIESD